MNRLRCDLPDVTLNRPKGLSPHLFFQVFYGANAIAYARLSSRTKNQHRRAVNPQTTDIDRAPSVSYCLRNIEVSQNYRNRGIGSALLEEIIHFCVDERISTIYGEAKGEIQALRHWYEDNGFELDSIDNIQLSIS